VFSEAWVLDLRNLGLLHSTRASSAASPACSTFFKGFSAGFTSVTTRLAPRTTVSAVFFSLHFWVFFCILGLCFSCCWLRFGCLSWVLGRVCSGLLGAFFVFLGWVFFGDFYYSWVLGFIRVLLLFGCLLGAFTVLGFGVQEGFGCCWVFRF